MTKVCRLCLVRLQRGSKYFNINAVESFTGFMPYRDQLTTCIPEMALDLIPNPVICNSCRNALKSSYDFKSRCLLVEKKIRQYVESQPPENTSYNLTEIDTSNLPKLSKFEPEISKEPPRLVPLKKTDIRSTYSPSILSNLLTVQKEVMLPNPSEIEITDIKYSAPVQKVKLSRKVPAQSQQISYVPIEKDEHGLFTCNHCDKKFPNIPSLHTHKTRVHEEDYLCNFCNVSFKTLQNLRKHNQMCQKANIAPTPPSQAVLAKRPHLPTKAKSHLKKWLFNHTDHPYPTDVEKQQLMKETNLSLLQVENWFINARRRILSDLTRLKHMRGGIHRGRRGRGGRGRGVRMDVAALEKWALDEDAEDLLDEGEAMVASRLLEDLDESNVSYQEPEIQEDEKLTYSIEDYNEDISKEEDEVEPNEIKCVLQKVLVVPEESAETSERSETSNEQDPLEDAGLTDSTANIKMEIELEER